MKRIIFLTGRHISLSIITIDKIICKFERKYVKCIQIIIIYNVPLPPVTDDSPNVPLPPVTDDSPNVTLPPVTDDSPNSF